MRVVPAAGDPLRQVACGAAGTEESIPVPVVFDTSAWTHPVADVAPRRPVSPRFLPSAPGPSCGATPGGP